MRLLTRLGLLIVFILLIVRAQEFLAAAGSPLDMTSFFAGVVATGVFGFVWFLVNNWYSALSGMSRPQSVSMETKQTPARVTIGSIAAFFKLLVFLALLGLISFVLLQDQMDELLRQLAEIVPR